MKIPLSDRIKDINTDKNSLILTNGVVRRALEKPFLDAVFEIYFYNCTSRTMGPKPHPEPIPINLLFADKTSQEIEEAILKCSNLLRWAFRLGDAILDRNEETIKKVNTEFLSENPGFSESSYNSTASRGQFLAR